MHAVPLYYTFPVQKFHPRENSLTLSRIWHTLLRRARNTLTNGLPEFDTFPLADIVWHETILPSLITQRHVAPTYARHEQTLQWSWSFARRTLASIVSIGTRVLLQSSFLLFVLLPIDVSIVGVMQQPFDLGAGDQFVSSRLWSFESWSCHRHRVISPLTGTPLPRG